MSRDRERGSKCAICGLAVAKIFPKTENVRERDKNNRNRNQDDILRMWKNECAKSICGILFKSESNTFLPHFQNGDYCSVCEQKIRDVRFSLTRIKSLEKQVERDTAAICKLIQSNYASLEKKSHAKLVKERIAMLEDGILNNYSYNETIEMIYTVTPNLDLKTMDRKTAAHSSVTKRNFHENNILSLENLYDSSDNRDDQNLLDMGDQKLKKKNKVTAEEEFDPYVDIGDNLLTEDPDFLPDGFESNSSDDEYHYTSKDGDDFVKSGQDYEDNEDDSDSDCMLISDIISLEKEDYSVSRNSKQGNCSKKEKLKKKNNSTKCERSTGRPEIGFISELILNDGESEMLKRLSELRAVHYYNLSEPEQMLIEKLSDCTLTAIRKAKLSDKERKFVDRMRYCKRRRRELVPKMRPKSTKKVEDATKPKNPRGRPELEGVRELTLTDSEMAIVEKIGETKTILFHKLSEDENALVEKIGQCANSAIRKLNVGEREKTTLFKMKKHKHRLAVIKKAKEMYNFI